MRKTAVVTASTKGIGRAIAELLLEKGCYVIMNYAHNDEDANRYDSELIDRYAGQYTIIKADLSTYEGMNYFTDSIIKTVHNIDYLFLNAGTTDKHPYLEVTPEIWNKIMDTNLNIPFFTVQKLSLHINENGRIIFIGSLIGQVPHSISIAYGVSKAGEIFLAKCLVKEFCDRSITVNAIVPGFVDTPWQINKAPDHRKRIEDKIALKRFAYPEEIAKLCYDVVENQYINGAAINIDGGYSFR